MPLNLSRIFAMALLLSPALLHAVTPSASLPDAPLPQQASSSQPPQVSDAEKQLQDEEKQRVLGVVPSFNIIYAGSAPPLNAKQKFRLSLRGAIDPATIAIAGLDAGVEEALDQYPEYGWGAQGYFKRFGASYADSFNSSILGGAVFPVLLHQDPRYFWSGHGSIVHRMLYAASTTVICKGDNGKWQPNYSNILGNIAAGGISNAYYPKSDRGVGLTFQRGLTVSAEGAIGAMFAEFWPDISRKFLHKEVLPPNARH